VPVSGAKQRTARNVTPDECFVVEADDATVGTNHVVRTTREMATMEVGRRAFTNPR
jgi:hypothetical protein